MTSCTVADKSLDYRQKGRARKKLISNADFHPLKLLKKKDVATPGNLMTSRNITSV